MGIVGALHPACLQKLSKTQRPPLRPRLRTEPQPQLMGRPHRLQKAAQSELRVYYQTLVLVDSTIFFKWKRPFRDRSKVPCLARRQFGEGPSSAARKTALGSYEIERWFFVWVVWSLAIQVWHTLGHGFLWSTVPAARLTVHIYILNRKSVNMNIFGQDCE